MAVGTHAGLHLGGRRGGGGGGGGGGRREGKPSPCQNLAPPSLGTCEHCMRCYHMLHNYKSTLIQQYQHTHMYGANRSQKSMRFVPPCQNLAPPGTCEHCMKCENKTSDAPPTLFVNFRPLLTIFLNKPLLMNNDVHVGWYIGIK